MGQDIGIKKIVVLGNRVKNEEDKNLIRESLSDFEILGFVPEHDEIVNADRAGSRPFDSVDDIPEELYAIATSLERMNQEK